MRLPPAASKCSSAARRSGCDSSAWARIRSSTSLISSVTGERKVTAFKSVSPCKEPRRVGSCDGGNLRRAFGMYFCYFISNMMNKGRFVPFATKRHGSEKWRVGFDEDFVKRQPSYYFAFFIRIFISHWAGDSEIKIERQRLLRGFEVAIERMQHARSFCKLSLQAALPFPKILKSTDASPNSIFSRACE